MSVQTDYRRNINPFEPGQIANARPFLVESGRLLTSGDNSAYLDTLPFGHAVGWVDGIDDRLTQAQVDAGSNVSSGRYSLSGFACANTFAAGSGGNSGNVVNFAGVAMKNITLPGDNAPDGTYNDADLVSIGSEGDFVVICKDAVSARGAVYIVNNSGTDADRGKFGTTGSNRLKVPGAIYMSDSTIVRPYNTDTNLLLAVVRIRQQPREV